MAGSLWPDSPLSLARIWKSRPKQPMNITCMAVSELENSARSHICSIYKLSPWAWKLSTLQKLMSRLSLFISKWSNKPQEPVEGREWNSISRASHMCHLTFMVTVQVGIIGSLIPSIFIDWNYFIRKSCLFFSVYLHVDFMDIYGLWSNTIITYSVAWVVPVLTIGSSGSNLITLWLQPRQWAGEDKSGSRETSQEKLLQQSKRVMRMTGTKAMKVEKGGRI